MNHKLSKIYNPSIVTRIIQLCQDYRLLRAKNLDDIDCKGQARAAAVEKLVQKAMGEEELSDSDEDDERLPIGGGPRASKGGAEGALGGSGSPEKGGNKMIAKPGVRTIGSVAGGGSGGGSPEKKAQRGESTGLKKMDTRIRAPLPDKMFIVHGEKLRYYGKFSKKFAKLFNESYADFTAFKTQ